MALSLLVPTGAAANPSPAVPRTGSDLGQAEPGDLLPDMELARVYGVTLRSTRDDRKRLRFGTRAFNIGAGPLEVRGRNPSAGRMTELVQWIANEEGTGREVTPPGGGMFWAGDGHRHWHVEQFINVELFSQAEPGSTRLIRKIGFCLLDLVPSRTPPPNAPPQRGYPFDSCGSRRGAQSITMGISVGYADDYQPLIAHQWIDVTTLPKGEYRLCATVNPLGHWLESDTANNFFWHDVFINPARGKAVIRRSGRAPCGTYAGS